VPQRGGAFEDLATPGCASGRLDDDALAEAAGRDGVCDSLAAAVARVRERVEDATETGDPLESSLESLLESKTNVGDFFLVAVDVATGPAVGAPTPALAAAAVELLVGIWKSFDSLPSASALRRRD
jgi:hypothetical protein